MDVLIQSHQLGKVFLEFSKLTPIGSHYLFLLSDFLMQIANLFIVIADSFVEFSRNIPLFNNFLLYLWFIFLHLLNHQFQPIIIPPQLFCISGVNPRSLFIQEETIVFVLEVRRVGAWIDDIVISASVSHCLSWIGIQIKQSKLHKMNQPQTLDQFRDFCKVLKLKIMKQKMIIEQLTNKNSKLSQQLTNLKKMPPSRLQKMPLPVATPHSPIKDINSTQNNYPDRPDINAGNLKGKNQIMKVLKNGATRAGITPQSIFRIADIHSKHQVQYDHFRNILSRMNLGLNPKQISTLIYMFDENCNSYIHQEQFIQTLQGYQVAEQDLENSTIFKHICLEKLATMIGDGQINPGNFYSQMNSRKDGLVDMSLFQEQIKKTFEGRIYEKEIAGAFYAMDLEGNGYLDRQNFVYGINSSIRKISTMGPSRKIDSVIREPDSTSNPGNTGMNSAGLINGLYDRTQNSKNPDNKKNLNNESRMTMNNQQNKNQQSIINVKIPLQSLSVEEVLGRLKQQSGVTLSAFYEELCRVRMNKRTTLFNFKKVFQSLAQGKKIEIDIVSSLFKLIDFQQKGSLHYPQLLYFYLAQSSDISMVLRLLGKYFFNNDLNCQRFWFLFGINPDSDISKHRFIEVMTKTFEGPEGADKLWEKLWSYFDKGRGVLPVAALSHQMAKYELVQNVNS